MNCAGLGMREVLAPVADLPLRFGMQPTRFQVMWTDRGARARPDAIERRTR